MVEVHGREEGFDRRSCLPQCHVAAATLFVEATEARVMPLERRERLESRRDLLEETLGNGRRQERVPLCRRFREQCLRGGERFGKAALPQEFVQVRTIRGRRRSGSHRGGGFHAWLK